MSLKDTRGKIKYFNRVDLDAGLTGVALVRENSIKVIKKYEESSIEEIAKEVPSAELTDATFRHLKDTMSDPFALDSESGLPHIFHMQFNLMVLAKQWLDGINPRDAEVIDG